MSHEELVVASCAAVRRRQGRPSSLRCGRFTLTAPTPAAGWPSTRSLWWRVRLARWSNPA